MAARPRFATGSWSPAPWQKPTWPARCWTMCPATDPKQAPAVPWASPAGAEMLSKEENTLLTRTGPGTPMGKLMRRYWIPALLAEEVPEADGPPVQVRILGEELVAFRDTNGRVG